jgi:20S proteasome subunit beta 3
MDKDELFETISNCLLSALDRDSLSGWGAYVYVLTPTELTVKALKTRQD